MKNQTQKDVRVSARISESVKETLQQAADLSGATLNQFLVQAALKEAQKILEAQQMICLSERDAEQVFRLIENPPVANEKLKAAFNKHKELLCESH
jgi:uncharacterized protein (DUF1778 family)